ncbi:hypothetical protein B0H11DRAFT_2294777 [Mycena galericulata]|nr:hypothetical protein B0H11DRAFT_2294777 [Mycena galericulata]
MPYVSRQRSSGEFAKRPTRAQGVTPPISALKPAAPLLSISMQIFAVPTPTAARPTWGSTSQIVENAAASAAATVSGTVGFQWRLRLRGLAMKLQCSIRRRIAAVSRILHVYLLAVHCLVSLCEGSAPLSDPTGAVEAVIRAPPSTSHPY